MAADVLSFQEALAEVSEYTSKPHVLLGNGFSISCRADCFTYGALLEEATFAESAGDLPAVFDFLGTTDFERVIELLRISADLVERYDSTSTDVCARMRHDAGVVRAALARVLAARHPDNPFRIADGEYVAARRFLANFERIYTLNYDMLLYWTVMKELDPPVSRNDGFGNPDDADADYVVWQPYETFTQQRVFYLHGGLHLYDTGNEVAKITWARTRVALVQQIREALAEGRYPLIVTEGTSSDKAAKILHSAYLNHAIRSLSGIHGALFLYGMSCAPSDDHLLRRIAENRHLRAIYVSLYGDPSSVENQETVARACALAFQRPIHQALQVRFYDAGSAEPWG